MMTIEVTGEGLAVERWVAPFRVAWEEIREVGLVGGRGQLTVRTALGTVTVSERLLGRKPFARLAAELQAHGGPAVHEWSAWAAARRELLLLASPAVGLAFLLVAAQGIRRRRLPTLRPGGPGR